MDKTERKRLKQQGNELIERRSRELHARVDAENPWPIGSPQWVERYKELNRVQQESVVRRSKLYPIPAWAARGRISSHIYIGWGKEASQYDGSAELSSERAELSRITPLELTRLWAIMRGIEWNESLVDGFERIREDNGARSMIYRFPGEIVSDLAEVMPEHIAGLARQWAASEHFAWRREATRRVIEELVRLAGSAVERKMNLYLWICF